MSITIDWATKIINVPQSYLTLVSGSLYSLDLNAFRLALKALEASAEGMSFDDTHSHNTELTVAGTTLARSLSIINGYTVTFEDGQYAVNLLGANSNVSDVSNINQVSLRAFNTAGLVVSGGSGLSQEDSARILDIYRILGLDTSEPLTVSATSREVGGTTIQQTISISGGIVTITRLP